MKLIQESRLLPGLAAAVIGVFLVWQGFQMPHARGWASSPGLFPIIIGSVLVVLAGLLLMERHRIRKKQPPDAAPERNFQPGDAMTVLGVTAGLSTYILALKHLPYEPVTLVFLIVAMWAFGARSIPKILLASVLFTLVITILFTQVLGTLVPGSYSLIESLFL